MNSESLRSAARTLMSPVRRPARPSVVAWETRETVASELGPVVTWSTGAGPAVVLVHGWDADHYDMDAFVGPLVAAGRRVVTFDLPGHGESAGEVASLFDFGAALEDVARATGTVDAVVAHSAGCAATSIALGAGLRIRRAAFVAPPLRYVDFVRYAAEQIHEDPDALVAAFRELGYDVDELDIRKNAARIDGGVPLLIVHSTDDRVCDPRNGTKIATAWRDATVEFVDGLGHNRILRDDAVVRRIVDFTTNGDPL